MAVKLFIGRLSFNTTDESLKALFAQYGTVVSAQVVIDRGTSQSKGFAFVEMQEQSEAEAAIKALDGNEFEGRNIVVTVSKPREDRPQFSDGNNFRK